jgi:hypothetical protein
VVSAGSSYSKTTTCLALLPLFPTGGCGTLLRRHQSLLLSIELTMRLGFVSLYFLFVARAEKIPFRTELSVTPPEQIIYSCFRTVQ